LYRVIQVCSQDCMVSGLNPAPTHLNLSVCWPIINSPRHTGMVKPWYMSSHLWHLSLQMYLTTLGFFKKTSKIVFVTTSSNFHELW